MSGKKSKIDIFEKLTWGDLEAWAGSAIVSRGSNYQRSHSVEDLVSTPEGALIAYVRGTRRYTTRVDVDGAGLYSICTCPYGGIVCKHAVAVVLEFLDHLKREIEVSTLSKRDPRPQLLEQAMEDEDWLEPGEIESDEEEEVDQEDLHAFLEGKSKTELVDMLEDLSRENPEIRRALEDRMDLAAGRVNGLVRGITVDIELLSEEPGWSNHWNDEGHIPDYSPVRERLEALLDGGYADEVLELGKTLMEAGTRQVEMSDDDGETGMEIASCIDVAFRALPRSSLSPAEQILWMVDFTLQDQYCLCETVENDAFWDRKYPEEEWSVAADRLLEWLEEIRKSSGKGESSGEYHRGLLASYAIAALKESGREEEVIPLCEREAVETGSYVRLVEHLIGAGRESEAERWIHKGITATEKNKPGIANMLREALRGIREREEDWSTVAAMRAEGFFGYPTEITYGEMKEAAKKAGIWPAVRAAAIYFLETGEPPSAMERAAGDRTIPPWPLPETGVKPGKPVGRPREFPDVRTLINIAIVEERPADVVRWYGQEGHKPLYGWMEAEYYEDRIARAIAGKYPDRAIAIWKKIAEGMIDQKKVKAYRSASKSLLKIHMLLEKLDREEEFQSYVEDLRQAHARKYKLIEILDRMTGGPIVDG